MAYVQTLYATDTLKLATSAKPPPDLGWDVPAPGEAAPAALQE